LPDRRSAGSLRRVEPTDGPHRWNAEAT
jgi:hypothetical protein